jgi:hypothetical protein
MIDIAGSAAMEARGTMRLTLNRLLEWLAAPPEAEAAPAPASAETHSVRGFRVFVENTRPDIATSDVLARLGDALGLIEQYQSWRFRHLERDLVQFRVARFPCRGAYFPDERTCLAELTFLARRDITPATVASSIVHEGIHARVDRMGVRRDNRDRAREERLCRRAELDFGRALPAELGEPIITRAIESLTLADEEVAPAIDWAEALDRQRAVDRAAGT